MGAKIAILYISATSGNTKLLKKGKFLMKNKLIGTVTFAIKLVSGMMLQYFLAQTAPVDMHVNLGRGNTFVPQHGLNDTQIGTAFQQVGGKGMTEGMGTDGFAQAALLDQLFYHVEYQDAGQLRTAPDTQKDIIFVPGTRLYPVAVGKPIAQLLYHPGRQRDDAFFVSLTHHSHKPFVQI